MRRQPKVHFYPGMGATSAMYADDAWHTLPNAIFHNWVSWAGETTLSAFAARLIVEHHISPGDIIGGSSMGGMVAGEIANQISVSTVVLLGSAIHPNEVSRILSIIHPLIDLSPVSFVKRCAGKVPMEISGMFAESEPEFIRAMCKAIFRWEGLNHNVRKLRVHGEFDKVIPPPQDADCLLAAGHLVAMSHPDECVGAILRFLQEPQFGDSRKP